MNRLLLQVARARSLATALLLVLAALAAPVDAARLATPRWVQPDVSPLKPLGRKHHTMVYDSLQHRTLVYAGENGSTILNDLWSLDLTSLAWQQISLPTSGPAPRHGHTAIWAGSSPYHGPEMVVYGGDRQHGGIAALSDTVWTLDLGNITWQGVKALGPCPRWHHTAVNFDGNMLAFGGRSVVLGPPTIDSWMQDAWSYGLNTSANPTWSWRSGDVNCVGGFVPGGTPPEKPTRRDKHIQIATNDSPRRTLVHGGDYEGQGGTDAWTGIPWEQFVPLSELTRVEHSAVYDPGNPNSTAADRVLIFGGYTDGSPSARLDALTLPSAGPGSISILGTSGAAPSARAGHSAIYSPEYDAMIVFGGTNGSAFLNDIHALQLSDDAIPPNTVTDVAIVGYTVSPRTVTLGWSAPRDSDITTRASSYEIRHSASPITDLASFLAGALVSGAPVPAAPGEWQTKMVSVPGTAMRWYAMRSIDEFGNTSAISNVACMGFSPLQICGEGEGMVASTPQADGAALAFGIRAVIPSPTTGPMRVRFALVRRGSVSLELIDVAGRRVQLETLEDLGPGEHELSFGTSRQLAAGRYTLRLVQEGESATRPVVVLR